MANISSNTTNTMKETLDFKSYKTSGDIKVPNRIIDQIIGQEEATETVKKAAKQRRNVLLIGEPGIGKSMLAKGMAELLPPEELQDVLVYPNAEDNHNPLIGAMPS
ncbi:MAG: ATP-binding protein, partial [Methanobacterium sp.]